MTIKQTTERIWWDDTADNKPNNKYFTDFKARMNVSDLKINQKAYNTIEIVTTNTNITYLWVNDDKYDYYFYFNRVLKVMNGTYLIEFTLDLYTTFTLPYFEYLRTNNIQVKINRHKSYELDGLQWEDDMINTIPKFVANRWWKLSRTKYWYYKQQDKPSEPTKKYQTMRIDNVWYNNDRIWLRDVTFSDAGDLIANTTIYVAFSDDESIKLIPCFTKKPLNHPDIWLQYYIPDGVTKPSWYDYPTEGEGLLIKNTSPDEIVKTIVARNHGKKILGLYMGPPFYMFKKENITAISIGGSHKFIAIDSRAAGFKISEDATGLYPLGELPGYIMKRAPKALNEVNFLSIYAANTVDLTVAGRDINIYSLITPTYNNNLYLGESTIFTFSTNVNLLVRSQYYPMSTVMLNYPADLPMFIDQYQVYLATTKSTRDTSLNIAKQNMIMGVTSGVINYAGNIFGSAAGMMKDPVGSLVGGVFGAANSIMGIAKAGLGYTQKKEMMQAELADKKASMKNTIQSGLLEDTAIATYILNKIDSDSNNNKLYMGDFIEYNNFNAGTTKAINNVLYLYGQYYPKIDTLNNLAAGTIEGVTAKFDYYKFDAEYLLNIFATTLRGARDVPIQREYYDYIFNQLTSGIRLWKQQPEY